MIYNLNVVSRLSNNIITTIEYIPSDGRIYTLKYHICHALSIDLHDLHKKMGIEVFYENNQLEFYEKFNQCGIKTGDTVTIVITTKPIEIKYVDCFDKNDDDGTPSNFKYYPYETVGYARKEESEARLTMINVIWCITNDDKLIGLKDTDIFPKNMKYIVIDISRLPN